MAPKQSQVLADVEALLEAKLLSEKGVSVKSH
jgi:hypothetical protein